MYAVNDNVTPFRDTFVVHILEQANEHVYWQVICVCLLLKWKRIVQDEQKIPHYILVMLTIQHKPLAELPACQWSLFSQIEFFASCQKYILKVHYSVSSLFEVSIFRGYYI